jgi:hypothetical protein
MRTTILVSWLGVLLGAAVPAAAQSAPTYRAQFTAEAVGAAGAHGWTGGSLFVATSAGSWEPTSRLRLAGGLALAGSRGTNVRGRVREAYVRVSATDWMDVEAGKRLLRWGVGYGFSPAGVLDPPRAATDPTDRLGLNEGRPMARVDLFRGDTSLTVAAAGPLRVTAARLRTVLPGGVEVALIGSTAPEAGRSLGGTVTHVIGQGLEWHAEVIDQDRRSVRAISAAAGVQYTFRNGTNVVVEYHRNGLGLEGRRQSVFVRVGRSSDAGLAPDVILVAGLDDGSRTLVPGITWTPHARLQLHARATRLFGGARSIARLAPWSTSLTLGATVRF